MTSNPQYTSFVSLSMPKPRSPGGQNIGIPLIAELNKNAIASLQYGDHTGSCRFFQEALKSVNQVLPLPELHVRSLAECTLSRSNAPQNSFIYQRQEYDEGMSVFQDPIVIHPEEDSVETANAILLFNLGQLCLSVNNEGQASYYFARALFVINSGAETSDREDNAHLKISIFHNIARLQYREGRYEEALKTYSRALNTGGQSFLQSFRHMLALASTLNCLGVLNFHLQSAPITKAQSLLEEALAIYRSVLGQDASSTEIATVLNNIGRVHYMDGRYDEATRLYSEALCIRRGLFGNNHIDTAATIFNSAQSFHQQGLLQKAMNFYEEFLGIAASSLGKEHNRDIAVAKKCLGQVHHELRNFDQAISLYKEAISIGKIALGTHPEVATCYNKLGNVLYENGDFEAALDVYREGLAVERAVLPTGHANIVVTLTNIGQIHKIRGDYNGALRVYKEVIAMQRQSSENDQLSVAATLSAIALIHYQTHNYSKALEVYQEALRIRRETLGDENLEVASSLNSIGLVLFKLEFTKLSLQSFMESLRVRRAILGSDHKDVAIILYNIATIYLEQGDDEEALVYYRETLRTERAALGESHPDVVLTTQQIAQVHQQGGELDKAFQYFQSALALQMNAATKDHKAIACTLNFIGNVHLQRGNTGEMMEVLSEAVRHLQAAGLNESDLALSGFNFYGMSKLHPECAPIA